jgi:hypothetical protein
MATPAKGKRFTKIIKTVGGRTRKVSYGQAGKASDGGDRIRPGTSKGNSYCSRSYGQMKMHPSAAKDKNSPLRLSRRKWRCAGKFSKK